MPSFIRLSPRADFTVLLEPSQKEYNRLESEFIRNGNRFTKNRPREIWARVAEEVARDSKRYIL